MPKNDLRTLDQTLARLEKLPELHTGRIWLNAIKAISAEELVAEIINGPKDYESLVWEAMITVGSLSDGKPRFHTYPSGSAVDDLAARDAAIKDILALKGPGGDAASLIELAARKPSTTFAVMVRAHTDRQDGPLLLEFLRHPDVSRREAIGWLKLTAEYIRKQESADSGNN